MLDKTKSIIRYLPPNGTAANGLTAVKASSLPVFSCKFMMPTALFVTRPLPPQKYHRRLNRFP
jgi:hypothetical protein